MGATEIRKLVTIVEETRREAGQDIAPPTRQCAAVAVIVNPYAGTYSQDLTRLEETGAELGALLVKRGVAALGISPRPASASMPPPSCTPGSASLCAR